MTGQSLKRNNKILFVFIPYLRILLRPALILFLNLVLDLWIPFPLFGEVSSGGLHLEGFILGKLLLDKGGIGAGGAFGGRRDEEAALLDDVFGECGGRGGGEAEEIIVANQAEHLNLN